jgi:hypothetical protein
VFCWCARVRQTACLGTSLGVLRHPRDPADASPADWHQAWLVAACLVHHNWVCAGFVRSFGGLCTCQDCDWDSVWDAVEAVADAPLMPGFPAAGFDRALRALTSPKQLQPSWT